MKRLPLQAAACLLACAFPWAQGHGEEIIIGTGSEAGVYYQVGRAICRLVNKRAQGVTCKAIPTPGSLHNLGNVRDGALDFGLAQSDWHYHAVHGTGPVEFMTGSFDELRAVFSVHNEAFTLVVRRDAGIRGLADLPGRRVNIGNPGSGHRATMEVVMQAMGWEKDDFALAAELNAAEQSLALCHDRIQAMVYTVGHPNPSVAKAIGLCDATLATVSGPVIDKLVADNPYYAYTTIPGGMYDGTLDPVTTFGVLATLVTSSNVEPRLVGEVVAAVFDDLAAFKRMHAAFGVLEPAGMTRDGLSAPLHDAARDYYERNGIPVSTGQ